MCICMCVLARLSVHFARMQAILKFFEAIAGFAKVMKLNYHCQFLRFSAKRHKFDYFYPLTAK